MENAVHIDLTELIALRRFARKVLYQPENYAVRTGNHLSKRRGRGMDFAEVRNYQPGDEIRHMEWRLTARTGKPHIKLYQEERERPVVLLADFSASMHFGTRVALKSVIAAKLAALIAWTAARQGDRIGALIYDEHQHCELMPQSREYGVLPLLAKLTQFNNRERTSSQDLAPFTLSDALVRLRRVIRPGSILVLISDFYQLTSADSVSHLQRLREHNDLLFYQVCDVLELTTPKPGLYGISDGRHDALLDLRANEARAQFQLWCDNRQAEVKQVAKQLAASYVQVTSLDNIPRLVYRTYPRRLHE